MNFNDEEEKILEFWKKNKIFEKSLRKDAPNGDFVFYDGPPFATGLPHYGHILASIIKDVIPRYQTMKGKRVPRKWGWDCHGLPIENLIEKEMNFKSKKDIEEYGVEKFNKKARESVLRYADEWKKIIPRIGRWVDMENDYKTMDMEFMESVWWVFKQLWCKGYVYKDYRSMHICPRCETTLSQSEVTEGYKDIKDISVIVKFEMEDDSLIGSEQGRTFILAWTTTPWTLPGNVALAAGEDIDYVLNEDNFIFAKDRMEYVSGVSRKIKKEFKGKDLIGKKYKPLFDYYSKNEKLENRDDGWKIYGADFVTTNEGTGVVHIAPAFGEDDMNLGKEKNLPFVQHVGMGGNFENEVRDFRGMNVKPKDDPMKTDRLVVEFLREKNLIVSEDEYEHSYPHCWRCDTPLLNYATFSWFVAVTKIKEKLLKNAENINWAPENIKEGRFGKWLEGIRDWSISRQRFWASAIPIWECEKCGETKVVGSIEEIRQELGGLNKIFLVRHAEAENNVRRINNSLPETEKYPLTKSGEEQARELAKILRDEKIDFIFSSPLLRAKQTAEIISEKTGIRVVVDDRLREVGLGEVNNVLHEELHKIYPTKESRAEDTGHGIESGADVRKRIEDFLEEINEKYKNKNIVVVSHGDPLQIFYGITRGKTLKDSLTGWYPKKGFAKQSYSRPVDLHRPYIDGIKFKCSCGKKMRRIPDVFDCWLESGSMPYAQMHYPFENKEKFEKNFPAEFIAEGVDQTRAWFYYLHVLATAVFDSEAFKNVIVNGIVLAEDGKKMSKKLNNYPDPMYIIEKYGADALRYYLLSSPAVRAESLNFSEKGVDEVNKKVISKIKNVLSFYKMYEE